MNIWESLSHRAADDYYLAASVPEGRIVRRSGAYSVIFPDYEVKIDLRHGTADVVKEGEGKIDTDSLEERLNRLNISKSHIAEARKGAESLNSLDDILDKHESDGTDSDLRSYLGSLGRSYSRPSVREASNRYKGAVAYTDGGKKIGVNSEYDEKVSQVARDAGIEKRYAHEYIVNHEKTHMSQPRHILNHRFSAELDVELRMAEHFYQKAMKVKDPERSGQYWKVGDYALSRANNYLKRYGQQLVPPSVSYKRAA